jgi:hypothetical protein
MRGTRIENEVEICATDLANKTKFMSINAKNWKTICEDMSKSKNPVILIVIHYRQNPLASV